MTNVDITINKSTIRVNAEGHSGYAEYGKDIVCAGISTITISFFNACMNHKNVIRFKYNDGLLDMTVQRNMYTEDFLEMLMCGLQGIMDGHEDNLKLTITKID